MTRAGGRAPSRSRLLPLLAAGVAVAALLLAAAWAVFVRTVYERPEPTARAAQPAPDAPPELEQPAVTDVQGTVERTTQEGAWVPVHAGDLLRARDAVRTGAASRADLAVGRTARLTVAEGTHVTVREVSAAVQRWNLVRGRLSVDSRPGGRRTLRVETESGTAVAESGAQFSVLAAPLSMAVAAQSGTVDLAGSGRSVRVEPGQQASVRTGEPPAPPAPLPPRLLLKVATAAQGGADVCALVQGRADAGTEVRVDGEAVEVAAGGRFSARVRRQPGREHVEVVTRDASGRHVSRRVPCAGAGEQGISHFSVRWKRGHGDGL